MYTDNIISISLQSIAKIGMLLPDALFICFSRVISPDRPLYQATRL